MSNTQRDLIDNAFQNIMKYDWNETAKKITNKKDGVRQVRKRKKETT